LTGGEWRDDRLCVHYHGSLPDLTSARLLLGERVFTPEQFWNDTQSVELQLPPEAAQALQRPLPVRLCWSSDGDVEVCSNPVYVCNQAALDAELEIRADDTATLDRLGSLDLLDEELEQLLADLDAALVIDRRSIWQLAGRGVTLPDDEDDDEALRLRYEDIDYAQLRLHPKIQQYLQRQKTGERYTRSRLQIILSSITGHFHGLLDETTGIVSRALKEIQPPEAEEAETEAEVEAAETEKKQRRQAQGKRLAKIFKGFVRRYLRGLRSSDFQELAGFAVLTKNYIIFSHLLWRLFEREWLEPQFIIESLVAIWQFFWGMESQPGYFAQLEPEYRQQAYQWVQEEYAIAELLTALHYSACLTRTEHWDELHLSLRDFWRGFVVTSPVPITAETLEATWRIVAERQPFEPPRPPTIIGELAALADFETKASFYSAIVEHFRLPQGCCHFEDVRVYSRARPVKCLVLVNSRPLTKQVQALKLLAFWMRYEELDYYRISYPAAQNADYLLFYNVPENSGAYWEKIKGQTPVDFNGPIALASLPWDTRITHLQLLAQGLNARLALPQVLSDALPARTEVYAQLFQTVVTEDRVTSLPEQKTL